MEFVIDEELRAVIPPLSKEEFEQLEQNILEYGCLDPLKVWPVTDSDEVILLDGHNRFKICSEHNVNYDTESILLIDRAAAIDWMITNQLGVIAEFGKNSTLRLKTASSKFFRIAIQVAFLKH